MLAIFPPSLLVVRRSRRFAEEWWDVYAKSNLETATLKTYASGWNRHALPRLGHVRLRDLSPAVVARFRHELEEAGVGVASVRMTMTMLQSMLRVAVEWQRIPANPVEATRKPSAKTRRAVRPVRPRRLRSCAPGWSRTVRHATPCS
ncbi:MAG TPA: hypothetical protein VGW75_10505 [Solirubrobacteraceae bacterium]|nr:hypothetical protein [Solirubrobacteraceae bacterium]